MDEMVSRIMWDKIVLWKTTGVPEYPRCWIDESNEKHNMPQHYVGEVGVEHYRMLSAIVSSIQDNIVVDIGTYQGCSALAMAANENVQVISYDIMNRLRSLPKEKNIEYRVENLLKTKNLPKTSLIMLDVDPHDAIQEPMFMNLFDDLGYKGIVICDDIHLSSHMEDWWNSIDRENIDLTSIGHHSGTGMVYFD